MDTGYCRVCLGVTHDGFQRDTMEKNFLESQIRSILQMPPLRLERGHGRRIAHVSADHSGLDQSAIESNKCRDLVLMNATGLTYL